MKNKNRNRLALRMLAAVLLLAASSSVFGQEYIRGASNTYICDTSIIRSVNNNTSLIYNQRGTSTFMLVSPGSNNVRTWKIEPFYVNDFEIIDGNVYFCGYKQENYTQKGIFGHFSISSFNTDSAFWYRELDSCMEFKKIDYYQIGGGMSNPDHEEHVVMIGSDGKRSNMLVDWVVSSTLSPSPTPPYSVNICDIYISHNTNESFDDVAVTENYVVVSSRRKENGLTHLDLWQFNRPTTIGHTIFSSSLKHFIMTSPAPETSVFLEHSDADRYAVVFREIGTSRIIMLLISAPYNLVRCLEIEPNSDETNIPIDVKYNKSSMVFDILARNWNYRDDPERSTVHMQIYHVTNDVLNNMVSSGSSSLYRSYNLWSIDLTPSSSYFFASGEKNHAPYLFKYRHDQWESCVWRLFYDFSLRYPERNLTNEEIEAYRDIYESKHKTVNTYVIPFPVICQ